jgi:hypothetical protein
MPTVEFKFSEKQKVKTVLGDDGVIDMAALQNGAVQYYVLMKEGNGAWFDEDQLEAI